MGKNLPAGFSGDVPSGALPSLDDRSASEQTDMGRGLGSLCGPGAAVTVTVRGWLLSPDVPKRFKLLVLLGPSDQGGRLLFRARPSLTFTDLLTLGKVLLVPATSAVLVEMGRADGKPVSPGVLNLFWLVDVAVGCRQ